MNQKLLNKVSLEERNSFIATASDLLDWRRDVDEGLDFVTKSLELNTIQQALVESLVELAIAFGDIREEARLKFNLDQEELTYIQNGWFDHFEMNGGAAHA